VRGNALCLASLILLLLIPVELPAAESLDEAIRMFNAGDFETAKTGFEAELEADRENQTALYYLGRIALIDEDLDGAIDLLRKAVKLDDTDSVYRTWLGRAYIDKLQTVSFYERGVLAGRALESLQKAVELDPSNVEARISLGGYYLNAPSIAGGSKKKAREQAEEVIKHDPVEGNAMLAGIHIKDKEYDQAIEKLRACIEAKPENIDYRYQLGMLYQELERYDDAFDVFERILEIDSNNTAALYQIGRTAAFSGTRIDRGIACLRIYLEKEIQPGYPGYDGAHWRLGMLHQRKGDLAMARSEYELAVRLNPNEDRYSESLKNLDEE
jgi:tetratricopeptide (TPR) repeat protein